MYIKKNNKKAFTIIELLVWITIISLITLWITKLYSSDIPDRQKLDLFTNKVIWIFDTVKNYSLVWKWIWLNLDTPKYFEIELSNTWDYLKTYYSTWWTSKIYYTQMSLFPFWEHFSIYSLRCNNLTLNDPSNPINDTIFIKYEWWNISLSWCTNSYQKIIDFEFYYKWFKKSLRLNSISWVLEQIK